MVKIKRNDAGNKAALNRLVWTFASRIRGTEDIAACDSFAAFLLYCTYVSDNHELLGIVGFDDSYAIANVGEKLGDEYVAKDFVSYYCALKSDKCDLPSIDHDRFRIANQARAITMWTEEVERSGISLADDDSFAVAEQTALVLTDNEGLTRYGKTAGDCRSSQTLANLVTTLADVRGKTVLDFVCGVGTFLSTAEMKGASNTTGLDINLGAANLAKIVCFFASPICQSNISTGDVTNKDTNLLQGVDRVVAAPSVGMSIVCAGDDESSRVGKACRDVFPNEDLKIDHLEDFCVVEAIHCLNDEGKAVVQVAPGFLFQLHRNRLALRKALIESGYLQAVIELPGGTYAGTSIKSALLVLTKERKYDDVLLVDLNSKELTEDDIFMKDRRRICEFTSQGVAWVEELVGNRRERDRVSALVSAEEFAKNDYNLCYSTYGQIVDVEALLCETRDADEIMRDIDAARSEVDELGKVISKLVASITKEGK